MATIEKLTASFVKELGFTPTGIIVKNNIAFSDGFSCIVKDNGNLKKTHGLAWRKEQH